MGSNFTNSFGDLPMSARVVEGVTDDPQHVKAVTIMDTPTHKAGVRFLGVVNYGSKCIPNISSRTSPLRNLITDKKEFQWFGEHEIKKLTKKECRIAQLKLTIQSDTELNTVYHYCKKWLAGSYSKSSNQSDNLQLKTKKRRPQLPCRPPK
ncbi:hypothetical protein NPIL_588161 [Nephila pilipes]|uniref:Uncharacterized protein n=1 Tax=Nephila pilipes TaxID=299642 RepID=A0A8X6QPQ5_NEPPI|nr:hypothetical protein NPIL_588161 [Nephila pilipes]